MTGRVFPFIYDAAMKPIEEKRFHRIREELVTLAEGRVLELGAGTGLNFPYYKDVHSVDAIDPNSGMINHAFKNAMKSNVTIRFHEAGAETLPFKDDSFDSIVGTLVFCTIPEPDRAIKELKRVSRPGAKILLFEHVRTDPQWVARTQDFLTPLWKQVCDGCHLNRDTLELFKQAGVDIDTVKSFYNGLFLQITASINK
ncbi:class I SAM-dependent methyltransferase [Halobacillus campisalis]|uniref:Class I SAM-dependent methyltransferase n=1 Tax=Halobacillus campisalis TaxID=435909 RepID=A0ABW2K6J2_9BACI|nr:class I SAM-dependent methyltransferase [Halobacillus campisalis]